MQRTCTFMNRWACQAFQHARKEKHAKASSSEPRTIEDYAHFTMWRWSYDTPWRHPSSSSTIARHPLEQQHECTSIVMSSHVELHHESCHPHLHYGLVINQCDVTWNSKRRTCKLKSHGSQMVMRVVEKPQGLVSPLAINTPWFVHVKGFSPQLLPHSQDSL